MSQIDICYSKADLVEYCLVETQGSLETDHPGGLRGQQRFAQIERLADGKVLMKIGVHRVSGSTVQLKKPLAVMTKLSSTAVSGDGEAIVEYKIQAIIKEKFIFKLRPEVDLQQEILKLPTV
ncbi:Chromosome transmission fidelity protein 8 [Coemansia sp. Benny D115]|nr:Chromosome transmission fidelity protein 8 [Coemansia sp. Benny D115]